MRTNPNKDIVIHMKTCGGDYHEGMAIYDTIKNCPNHVTIISYTHARSMSSLIIQAADLRLTMPNSYFMIHDGSLFIGGTVKQVNSYVEFTKVSDNTMMDIYIDVMREKGFLKTDEQRYNWLRDKMDKKEEVYLTAEEAIEYGFIDKIYDGTI
jgi:ATP-dependent protease ClpP protease subunit